MKETNTTENTIKFEKLGVKEDVIKALKEEGIYTPTTIQEKGIPLVHQGKDLIGISRTGSGKTAAFGIPLIEKMKKGEGVQGLVLAPTRELANQISKEFQKWSKYCNLTIATVFGGVAIDPQANQIARSEIVVGTPGRIIDHLQRGTLELNKLTCLALDEADKMVEMGFIEDVERVITAAPADRQILLFGATISDEIDDIKERHMKNVAVASAELHVKKDLLEQYYCNVKMNEKFSALVHLITKEDTQRVIIFCSKRSTVELIQKNLREQKIKADMIHGKMRQNKRLQVIERFNKGQINILVASAVAARGLDIRDVTHVFNYDLSQDPQEYIHRVGRTARAGESGKAITLLAPNDHGNFHLVLQRYSIEVDELELGDYPKVRFNTSAGRSGDRRGGYGGARSSGKFGARSGGYSASRSSGPRRRRSNSSGGWKARDRG